MFSINVRKCQTKDISSVISLMEELKEVAATNYDFKMEDVMEIFEEMEKLPEIYYNLVAEVEGEVVGFISVIFYKTIYHKGGTALINELIIKRNYRGKGIGSLLIEKVKKEAIKRGMDEIEVGTEITNKVAQAFYRKCNFTEEHVLLGMEF